LAAVQQMFKAVGVNLSIQPMETTTRVAKFKAGEYQMRTALWTNDLNDPSQITSYFAYYPTVQSNFSGFRDTKLEELFVQSQSEVDPKKRAEQYRQIQEIFVEAAPHLFLLEVPYPVALRKGVTDFVQLPLGNYLFSGVHLEH
jgi:peptide/nickel transport system substrate-binding protein